MSGTRFCLNLVLSAAAAVTLFAAADSSSQTIERGRKEFVAACGFCHGNDASGNRAPDLIRSPMVNRDEGGNLVAPMSRNGRPEKEMPAFPALRNQQVSDIVEFLHFRIKEAMSSNRVPTDYPLSKLLTGDAAQGKAFF